MVEYTTRLAADFKDRSCPAEVNQLGRTIGHWSTQITNWHLSRVTNGPTEALNNLIKRIKRAAFGFRNFANYRIRALRYAGRPEFGGVFCVLPGRGVRAGGVFPLHLAVESWVGVR